MKENERKLGDKRWKRNMNLKKLQFYEYITELNEIWEEKLTKRKIRWLMKQIWRFYELKPEDGDAGGSVHCEPLDDDRMMKSVR